MFFSQVQKVRQIFVLSLEIEFAPLYFVVVPHDIDTECVESHRLDHQYPMLPILDWDARIVDFTCVYLRVLLVVVAAGVDVGFERLVSPAVMQVCGHTKEKNEQHGGYCCVAIQVRWHWF